MPLTTIFILFGAAQCLSPRNTKATALWHVLETVMGCIKGGHNLRSKQASKWEGAKINKEACIAAAYVHSFSTQVSGTHYIRVVMRGLFVETLGALLKTRRAEGKKQVHDWPTCLFGIQQQLKTSVNTQVSSAIE